MIAAMETDSEKQKEEAAADDNATSAAGKADASQVSINIGF